MTNTRDLTEMVFDDNVSSDRDIRSVGPSCSRNLTLCALGRTDRMDIGRQLVETHSMLVGRVETWLLRDGVLRRPMSDKTVSKDQFREERESSVRYVVYQRQEGTYSDGKGGLPFWRRLKKV